MIRPNYIPPSLLSEGLYCTRRLWLRANNVEFFEEKLNLIHAKSLKEHVRECGINDSGWRYEARLPSGSRLDAWIPDESLGIEFKSGHPHATHLYQVWALHQELLQLGVQDAEMQLWYQTRYGDEAKKLAGKWGLDHGQPDENICAICTDTGDPDFMVKMERSAAILIGEMENKKMPEPKEITSEACRMCSFVDWCHS